MSELEKRLYFERKERERNKISLFEFNKIKSGTGLAKKFMDHIKPKKSKS